MNIYIDANVIISVFNKEYPAFGYAARVLSLADDRKFKLFTSPLCLAMVFYFASKKSGAAAAKKKIQILAGKISIAENKQADILQAAGSKKIHDFEDGLQYFAAIHAKCQCIVTADTGDFYFSDIEVCTPEVFLAEHVLKNK